jgi:hypothetical protein
MQSKNSKEKTKGQFNVTTWYCIYYYFVKVIVKYFISHPHHKNYAHAHSFSHKKDKQHASYLPSV